MEINSNETDADISHWADTLVLPVGYLFDDNFRDI